MALDWDAFFQPQSIHMPNDQWHDLIPSSTTPPHASQMPKPISNETLESTLDDTSRFDSLLNESLADSIFSDSLFIPNDYFLSDLDVLPPFENVSGDELTIESASEPLVDVDQYSTTLSDELDQSPQIVSAQGQDMSVLAIDLSRSPKPSTQRLTAPRGTTKRNKNKPDIRSACWTSPLCPNHDQNGPPPDPSTCGGGCAPFLFASEDSLPLSIINNLVEPREIIAEDGIVEVQPRPKRRSGGEMTSTEKTSPKQEPSKPPTDTKPHIKRATPETTSPTPPPSDPKQAPSRRRLPHNQVERKYRESLNTQLESLRRVVPSLQQPPQLPCDSADMEDLQTPAKPSKAVILASATAYIKQQEKDRKSLAEENEVLRAKLKRLQKMVRCDDCSLMQYVVDLKIKQDG